MSHHIYALLVGIDEYLAPVFALRGCVNDAAAMKDYLEGRIEDQSQLHIQTLFNQEATYGAIVTGFRSHLRQAKNGDVVLFYYAGHGSQEQTPEAFWAIEPDHQHETLVCYDSRTPRGKDLADKELAKLIAEVAEHNPQITIVLDCCHSGSGTREIDPDTAVRQTPADARVRSLDDFLFTPKEIEQLSSATDWAMPRGKHVLFSACRDRELAKEVRIEGQSRGAFSYYLMDTLKRSNESLTIRDLFKRTYALTISKVTAQSPQLEAISGELDQPFLGGTITPRSAYFTVSYHKDYEWVIDGGAIHGIPQPSAGETTILALFPFDTSTAELRMLSHAIAKAQVLKVMPNLSQVQIEGIALQPEQTFKAIVTSLPLPPKGIVLTGDQIGLELARTQLQSSLYVKEAEEAAFKLIARDNSYWITRSTDDRPLVAAIQGYTPEAASQVVHRLEHIARWTNIVELASPAVSRIRSDAVQMQIYQNNQELQDLEIRLTYQQENNRSQQPTFKVKLRNTSNESLYCALLDLTDRYAVDAGLFEAGGIWLDPGQEVWALGNRSVHAVVPESLWKQGITETRDILKLIVSTTEFDATLLEQAELGLPTLPARSIGRGQGTLNRLMNRVQRRDLRAQSEEPICDDWVTSQISITTVRPQSTTPISRDRAVTIAPGVQLSPHPISATARLTTETQSVRDLGDRKLPVLQEMQPFEFVPSRGNNSGLSVLELSQVSDRAQVTAANPLKLLLETPLEPNEYLLPISYDGEFFLPLGHAQRTAENRTEIILERLTEPISEGQRSLSGSIRIFFQKVVTDQLGLQFDYPLLGIADVSPDETVTYTHDLQQIKARVAQADRIVLYVHGIIGDTQSIVPSLQRAKLSDRYDLILTFDYENLNTSIEENARLLKQRLAAVGLNENHSKMLHIIAHSSGGLVSRWLIEKEGGDRIVQHLIMFGTPNAGTPWATIHDWAVFTLSIGLNGLSKITWSAPIVGMLIKIINESIQYSSAIHINLDQMRPGSDLLQALATSVDRQVPYTIVAGNTSVIPTALQVEQNQQRSPLERLIKKLFYKFVELPFFSQSNDIVATVRSINSVNWITASQIHEVGCDHLVYFSDTAGLEALSKAVIQAQK